VEESFQAGVRHGPFVEYHRNGKVARQGRYVNGSQDGPWVLRYESGAVEEEAEYRDGVAHGRFAAYRADGSKRSEGRRCAGAPCGTWRTYDARGHLEGEVTYETPTLAP